MLDNLLHIAGVDLQAQLAQVTARANDFKDAAKREIRDEIAHAGMTAGLALAAMMAFAATCVIALIAFYMWMEPQYGAFKALAAVGAVTACFALATGMIAASRSPVAPRVPRPVAAAQPKSRVPLKSAAAVSPPNASPVDVIAQRVSAHAAGMTDEAIDAAHDTIANGSRTALVGTLAAAIVVGWLVGRRGGN